MTSASGTDVATGRSATSTLRSRMAASPRSSDRTVPGSRPSSRPGSASSGRPRAASLVDGIDPWRDRGAAIERIGYVPQAPSLYRELTVDEHVTLARSLRPRFDAAIARRRLDDLDIPLEARADELSGGQQAQIGLALALGARAPVLLLDEPLASLDPLARREFLHVLVDAVRADGATALLSSHVITDIEQACDRLLVLGGGRKLLDLSIAGAIAEHVVVDVHRRRRRRPREPAVVGTFPGPTGERLSLVRGSATGGRPATLEEIVLGHLAAGRKPRSAADERAGMRFDGVRITLRLHRFELIAFGAGLIGLVIAALAAAWYVDSLKPSPACILERHDVVRVPARVRRVRQRARGPGRVPARPAPADHLRGRSVLRRPDRRSRARARNRAPGLVAGAVTMALVRRPRRPDPGRPRRADLRGRDRDGPVLCREPTRGRHREFVRALRGTRGPAGQPRRLHLRDRGRRRLDHRSRPAGR